MSYDYGNWLFVALNIIVFLVFLKTSFQPRTKTDWRTYNSFAAFLVALFTEMYGFPLTIYLLTSLFGSRLNLDFSHESGHLLNRLLGLRGDAHFNFLHLISNLLIVSGFLLIASAWKVLYESQKNGKLATAGPYHLIRHPQYLGFILIILGFLFQWPTLIILIMAPILIIRYFKLAKAEEIELTAKYGSTYKTYERNTPRYFPKIGQFLGLQNKT